MQKRWKYDDTLCTGCGKNEETGQEILMCDELSENPQNISYSWFYKQLVKDQVSAAKVMMKKLKLREKLREEVTWEKEKTEDLVIPPKCSEQHLSSSSILCLSILVFWTCMDIIYI